MKQPFILIISCCAALALVFVLASCREDAIIKSSLTPAVDNIHTFGLGQEFNNHTDTMQALTMHTKTAYEDSVVTSARSTGFPIFHALGWVKDPFAGKTAASIYMEVLPTSVSLSKPIFGNPIDSIVLVLPYAGFTWGDSTSTIPTTVRVYALADTIRLDTNFYNFSSKPTMGAALGSATFKTGMQGTGSIQDSVTLADGTKVAPHLRIALSSKTDTAYNSIFRAALNSDSLLTSFRSQLKGFCITPDTAGQEGATLPYFRLNGSSDVYGAAAMLVYVRNGTATTDTVFQFPYIETAAGHFNRITRNYTGTDVDTALKSTVLDASTVVMQNGPGAAVDLVMPFINTLPKNIIINKAELVFTMVPTTNPANDAKFFGPARLYPGGINSTGGRYTIADRYPITDQTLDFMDGTAQTVVKGGKTLTQYRINIPREIQKAIVQSNSGLHLRIGGTVNFPAAYRLLMGGSGNPDQTYRPYINIIYSKQ